MMRTPEDEPQCLVSPSVRSALCWMFVELMFSWSDGQVWGSFWRSASIHVTFDGSRRAPQIGEPSRVQMAGLQRICECRGQSVHYCVNMIEWLHGSSGLCKLSMYLSALSEWGSVPGCLSPNSTHPLSLSPLNSIFSTTAWNMPTKYCTTSPRLCPRRSHSRVLRGNGKRSQLRVEQATFKWLDSLFKSWSMTIHSHHGSFPGSIPEDLTAPRSLWPMEDLRTLILFVICCSWQLRIVPSQCGQYDVRSSWVQYPLWSVVYFFTQARNWYHDYLMCFLLCYRLSCWILLPFKFVYPGYPQLPPLT